MLRGAFLLCLRASTLALRFCLPVYVIATLGLADAGRYGLAMGVIGLAPAVIGWGLNYFFVRDLAGLQSIEAMALIRLRLAITCASLAIVTLAAFLVCIAMGFKQDRMLALVFILVWLETLGLDMHMAMIARGGSVKANAVLFIRAASWIPILPVASLILPDMRSLNAIFLFWIFGHAAALSTLVLLFRRRRMTWFRGGMDMEWLKSRRPMLAPIYISDLAIAAALYTDRYIVNGWLGLEAAGVYLFYWSLTNALQILITSVIVQPATPAILSACRRTDDGLAGMLARSLLRLILLYAGLAGLCVVFVELGLNIYPYSLPRQTALFGLLVVAAGFRASSDLLNVSLNGLGKDRVYAATNIAGVILSSALGIGLMPSLGIAGMGVAVLVSAIGGFLLRFWVVCKDISSTGITSP